MNNKVTAYEFWRRVDALNESSLSDMARTTGIRYQRIKDQRSADKYPTLIDTCAIADYLNTSVEYLVAGVSIEKDLTPEAIAVNSDPDLQCLVRLCLDDRQLFSVIKHLIQAPKVGNVNVGEAN